MAIAVINRDEKSDLDFDNLADWKKIAEICFEETKIFEHQDREVCLSFCSEAEIQVLNKNFRSKDKVTDVLSFNTAQAPAELDESCDYALGDIIICTEQAARQAQEYGFSLRREIIFLFIHGLLHLLGYDHETELEAREMFAIQKQVLLRYGILD